MKPTKTLTQLEEEPETGFFGATYTEIIATMRKSIIVTFGAALLISTIIPWEVGAIIGILVGMAAFYILLRRIGSNRADKPLYYHLHIKNHDSKQFIQAAKYYQRERNAHDGKELRKRTRS